MPALSGGRENQSGCGGSLGGHLEVTWRSQRGGLEWNWPGFGLDLAGQLCAWSTPQIGEVTLGPAATHWICMELASLGACSANTICKRSPQLGEAWLAHD